MATDALIRALSLRLQPVRRLPSAGRRTIAWAIFAAAWVAIGTLALGTRADLLSSARDPRSLCGAALLLAVFLLSARSAFQLSVPGAERGVWTRTLPIAALLAWASLVAGSGPLAGSIALRSGWPCAVRMAALGAGPALAALAMLRRAAPLRPAWTGWSALLSSASLAAFGTQLVCAKDDPRHLLLWHLGPLLAAALLGADLGRWSFGRRPVRP